MVRSLKSGLAEFVEENSLTNQEKIQLKVEAIFFRVFPCFIVDNSLVTVLLHYII